MTVTTDIENKKYRFPGENPGTQPEGSILIQRNEKEAVDTQTEDDFSAGSSGSESSADTEDESVDLNTDNSSGVDDFSGGDGRFYGFPNR